MLRVLNSAMALGTLIGLTAVSVSVASIVGNYVYELMRRAFYNRPLTTNEKWAETTSQSNEELLSENVAATSEEPSLWV